MSLIWQLSYFNAVHMEDAKLAICLQVALNSNCLNLFCFLSHFHVRPLSLLRWKKTATAATSHCLGTGIHIHVSQILLDLILSIGFHQDASERSQIWFLVSNVCLPGWQFQYMFLASTHVERVGCCFSSDSTLVPLSQEHTTSVEILYRKKENGECVDGEHDPTDVETSSLVFSFIQ